MYERTPTAQQELLLASECTCCSGGARVLCFIAVLTGAACSAKLSCCLCDVYLLQLRHFVLYHGTGWLSRSVVAGEVLEQAVLLSVRLQDEAAFERNFTQLKTYYTDTR